MNESTHLLSNHNTIEQNDLAPSRRAISIIDALKVPVSDLSIDHANGILATINDIHAFSLEISSFFLQGVMEYSASLFFSKLVSYTFLYWLPKYIENSTKLGAELSAYMSLPFDVGGLLGAIIAGYFADTTGASGLVCIVMLILLFPALVLYLFFASSSIIVNIIIQTFIGIMINGPYCLITTSVSADLGNRVPSEDAMATITAIIDGTGSIGAAVGPLIAGLVADSGWNNVFYMVMVADLISMCLLYRIGKAELIQIRDRRRNLTENSPTVA